MNDVDVIVVGGGVSGLATAWWLAREGLSVQVWEAADRLGGQIESRSEDGYQTERAANLLMNFRPEVEELVRGANLEHLKTARTKGVQNRYLLTRGRLTPISMRPGGAFFSPAWSWRGRLRMLVEPLVPAGGREEETVTEFITRRLGREVLEQAIEPYVAGTLAGDPDRASAAATLPRLVGLERRYGSIAAGILVNRLRKRRTACVTESFSFQGGMETLIKGLARAPGVRTRTGCAVEELAPVSGGWRVTASTPEGSIAARASAVVVAAPATAAARLIDPLDGELAALVDGIRYAPLTVVHLGLARTAVRHPLDGTGFLSPKGARLPVNGNLWMSSLFDHRAPAGKVLLTSYLGGARYPEAAGWHTDRAIGETVRALTPILGLTADPEWVRVDHHNAALPLYDGAHQARERAIEGRLNGLPGLYLQANYMGGVSVRDRIAQGHNLAGRIAALAPKPASRPLVAGSFDPRPLSPEGQGVVR